MSRILILIVSQIASPAGIWAGPCRPARTARSSPYKSRLGPGRDMHGHLGHEIRRICSYHGLILGQPGAGPGWESTGLALTQTNPAVPRVARTNPVWDQTGLAVWDLACHNAYKMFTVQFQANLWFEIPDSQSEGCLHLAWYKLHLQNILLIEIWRSPTPPSLHYFDVVLSDIYLWLGLSSWLCYHDHWPAFVIVTLNSLPLTLTFDIALDSFTSDLPFL